MNSLRYMMLVLVVLSGNAIAAETSLQWPMGDSSKVTETYGPRYKNPHWFHNGMDITARDASGNYTEGLFVAPFKGTLWELNLPDITAPPPPRCEGTIKLVPTDTTSAVKGVTFIHVRESPDGIDLQDAYNNDTEIEAGTVIGAVDFGSIDAPCPAHLHLDVYNNFQAFSQGQRTSARHPLQWLSYPTFDETVTMEVKPADSAGGSFPTDSSGKKYIEITVRQKADALSLNRIELLLSNSASQNTASFLECNCTYVDFNLGSGLDKSFTASGPDYIFQPNGPIMIQPYNFDRTMTEKKTVFRFYLKSTSSLPTKGSVTIKNMISNTIGNQNNLSFPVCIGGCNLEGRPLPPPFLTATSTDGGVQLSWAKSPDDTSPYVDTWYVIYRRTSASPDVSYAVPIGYAEGTTFFDALVRQTEPVSEPGIAYKYSIAAMNREGEGPNGPCVNEQAYKAHDVTLCAEFLEVEAHMPPAQNVDQWFVVDNLQQFPFDPNDPRAVGSIEGTFTIRATFRNASSDSIFEPFFRVAKLESQPTVPVRTKHALINADGGLQFPGEGATLTPTLSNRTLSPDQSITVDFVIGLLEREPIVFFVDVFGVPIPQKLQKTATRQ